MIPYMAILAAFGFLSQERRLLWQPLKAANVPPKFFKGGQEDPEERRHYPKAAKNLALRACAREAQESFGFVAGPRALEATHDAE